MPGGALRLHPRAGERVSASPASKYRSLITVTLVLGVHQDDVRTNDLDAMASVTHGAAYLVERFYPHLQVVSCESSVSNP